MLPDSLTFDYPMSLLPHNLYTSEQVQQLDRLAIDRHKIPGATLMERAGAVAFSVLRKRWTGARSIAVLCGVGNNGGDGFVLARLAHGAAMNVDIFQVGDPAKIKGDAAIARQQLQGTGINYAIYQRQNLRGYDVIVDGLLGTGLSGDVSGIWRDAIEAINQTGRPVLALDIPSGLHGDTGRILGSAVRASVTVTFIGLKQGILTGAGPGCSGKVVFSDLQVPEQIYQDIPPASHRLDRKLLEQWLPPRRPDVHKGACGHVLIIGGNVGMGGAAAMAAEAAGRVGAGLLSVATCQEHTAMYHCHRPEIMAHGIEDAEDLAPLLEHATVVAIGPGLGQDPWAQALLEAALESKLPLVVDADALNLMAKIAASDHEHKINLKRGNWILTPHPGEAGRLLRQDNKQIQEDRFSAIRELQTIYGGVVVLKGAGTLVVSENFAVSLCAEGNPGMASGGMGDVLTGVIAGLVAQGLPLVTAAQCGVLIHALAADRAAQDGERGLLASDLFENIRHFANPVRR